MSQLAQWKAAEEERMNAELEPLSDALVLLMAAGILTDKQILDALKKAWRAGKKDAHAAPTIPASATGYRLPGAPSDYVPPPKRSPR